MGLRNTLVSAGLVSILGTQEVQAQDTGKPYTELSAAEVQAKVLKRAQRFRYEDFKRLEGKKDFDGVVLASSTCATEKFELFTHDEIIFLQLMEKYEGK